jgi:hypothetical protein
MAGHLLGRRTWLVLGTLLVLVCVGCDEDRKHRTPTPNLTKHNLSEWKERAKEWKKKQQKLRDVLDKLERDKRKVLEGLADLGVDRPADLKGNVKGQVLAQELQELVRQIATTRKMYDERDEALFRMESAVRRGERILALKEVGVTEEELANLSKLIVEQNEKLTRITDHQGGFPELDVEVVLERELSGHDARR